jgi:predicted acetyltransferase
MITVRLSRREDDETLAAIAAAAFKTPEPESFGRFFREHTARGPADTLVAEIGGRIAGHMTALRLKMRFRGAELPVRGVSVVAVAPEHRQVGVAERLLRDHVRRLRARGEPFSLLYPFAIRFYQKHGWGAVEHIDSLRLPPASLLPSPLKQNVRRVDLASDGAALRAVYAKARERSNGYLARDEYWWERRVLGRVAEKMAYVDPKAGMEGYLFYDVPTEPAFPGQHALVRELIATTPAAAQGLVGFLGALGDQYSLVEILVPRGTGPTLAAHARLLTDDDHGHFRPIGVTLSGVMARIIDVPTAFAAHPAATSARGRIGLDVTDPMLPRPVGYDVTFSERGARATPGRRVRQRLALTIDRLAQIYFAAARATLLLDQGHAEGHPDAAARLDEAFAGPPLFLSRLNFF